MSYAAIPQSDYSVLYPHSMTHAGSRGWTRSYMPSWGANPLQAGPAVLGETDAERYAGMAAAMMRAGAAAQQASDWGNISGSANETVAREDKAIVQGQSINPLREQYTKTSMVPYILLGGASLIGIGLIVYAFRK